MPSDPGSIWSNMADIKCFSRGETLLAFNEGKGSSCRTALDMAVHLSSLASLPLVVVIATTENAPVHFQTCSSTRVENFENYFKGNFIRKHVCFKCCHKATSITTTLLKLPDPKNHQWHLFKYNDSQALSLESHSIGLGWRPRNLYSYLKTPGESFVYVSLPNTELEIYSALHAFSKKFTTMEQWHTPKLFENCAFYRAVNIVLDYSITQGVLLVTQWLQMGLQSHGKWEYSSQTFHLYQKFFKWYVPRCKLALINFF